MNADDVDEIRQMYLAHKQDLFTYALSLTGSREAAEDVVHGVIERTLDRPEAPQALRPYLFRAIRNGAMDLRRHDRVRQNAAPLLTPPEGAWDPRQQLELEEALAALAPSEKELVVLKIRGGLTFREIAAVRGETQSKVSSGYYRALEKLKTQLMGD